MIFAIGLLLFVPCFCLALLCGMAKVSAPEWLEITGGLGLLVGAVMMIGSFLWHAVPHLWRVMP